MATRSRILTRGGAALVAVLAGSAIYTIPHVHNDLTQEALRHLAVELGAAETYQGQPHRKADVLESLSPYGITNLTVAGHTATVHGSPRTADEIARLKKAAVRWGVADLVYEVDPDAVASGAQVALAGGVVTLRGIVASEAQRRVLVGAAQGVYGAANVVDRMTLDDGAPAAGPGNAPADRTLTDAQVAALAALVTSAGRASALEGWVSPSALRFRARVASSAEKAAADAAAGRAAAAGLTVDSQVTADAAAAPEATVSLANGVVTLRGTVASEAQRRALVSAAQAVHGTSNVVDQLTVSSGAGALTDAQVNAFAALLTAAGKASSLEGSVSPTALRFRARVAAGTKAAADAAAARAGSVGGLRVDSAITEDAPVVSTTAAPTPTTAAPTPTTAAPAPTTTAAPPTTVAAPTLDQQVDLLQKELDALAAIQLQSVFFASGSAALTPEANAVLVKVAEAMARFPLPVVEVGGHTDSDGNDEANRVLSDARASAVRQALVGLGVASPRLSAVGFGETAPRADNATPEGRALNRRVEFVVRKG